MRRLQDCWREITPNCQPKKVSGRWGQRPLGRGDGGYCNPKLVWFFLPFCCAREQQNDTQEQTGHCRCKTPESQTTSEYPSSLPSASWAVDSSVGSFSPVLLSALAGSFLVPRYFSSLAVQTSVQKSECRVAESLKFPNHLLEELRQHTQLPLFAIRERQKRCRQ